jgi:integrase
VKGKRFEHNFNGVRYWLYTKPRTNSDPVWYVAVANQGDDGGRYAAVRSLKTTSRPIAKDRAERMILDGSLVASREDIASFFLTYWTPEKSRAIKAKRAGGRGPSDQTCANNRAWIKNHFLPYCQQHGVSRLDQLTYVFLQDWVNELAFAGKVKPDAPRIGKATVNKVRKSVGQALRQAVKEGLLVVNPMTNVEAVSKTPEEAEETARQHIEWEDLEKILQRGHWSHFGAYVATMMALGTGAREGELRGLLWRSVDLERGLVDIVTSWSNYMQALKPTKTGAKRLGVILPKHVVPLLESLRESSRYHEPTDFVFQSDEGARDRPINPGRFLYHFRQAAKRAGVTLTDRQTFHSLRHTNVSYGVEAGESRARREALMEVVGHSSEAMQNIYVHQTAHQKQAIADEWDERFSKIG